ERTLWKCRRRRDGSRLHSTVNFDLLTACSHVAEGDGLRGNDQPWFSIDFRHHSDRILELTLVEISVGAIFVICGGDGIRTSGQLAGCGGEHGTSREGGRISRTLRIVEVRRSQRFFARRGSGISRKRHVTGGGAADLGGHNHCKGNCASILRIVYRRRECSCKALASRCIEREHTIDIGDGIVVQPRSHCGTGYD